MKKLLIITSVSLLTSIFLVFGFFYIKDYIKEQSIMMGKEFLFDEENKFKLLGKPIRLEYYEGVERERLKLHTIPKFVITDKVKIESAVNEIRKAHSPDLLKGSRWGKIMIIYSDTVLEINTNTEVIGYETTGDFYQLDDDNFITKHINKQKK